MPGQRPAGKKPPAWDFFPCISPEDVKGRGQIVKGLASSSRCCLPFPADLAGAAVAALQPLISARSQQIGFGDMQNLAEAVVQRSTAAEKCSRRSNEKSETEPEEDTSSRHLVVLGSSLAPCRGLPTCLGSWPSATAILQKLPSPAVLRLCAGLLLGAMGPLCVDSGGGAAGAVVAACPSLPLALGHEGERAAFPRALSLESLERLTTGVFVTTILQGSLGMLRMSLGDQYNGAYILLLAILGFNSRQPGPASNFLKTYVLIAFINGTMNSVDLTQSFLLHNFPLLSPALPLSMNLVHAAQLATPLLSFAGAYCGWESLKLQKRLAFEAQQREVMDMLLRMPPPRSVMPRVHRCSANPQGSY